MDMRDSIYTAPNTAPITPVYPVNPVYIAPMTPAYAPPPYSTAATRPSIPTNKRKI